MNEAKKTNLFMLFILLYIILLSTLLLPIVIYMIQGVYSDFKISGIPLLLLSQFLTQVVPIVVFFAVTKKKITEVLPFRNPGILNVVLIILMALLIQPFMMFLSAITALIYPNSVSNVISGLTESKMMMLAGFIVISVTPSICEEFVYRGIIFTGYRKAPVWFAALVNGLFFGIMHTDPQQFLYAFVLGFIFSYILYYSKSIFSTMLFHFVINGSQSLLLFVSQAVSSVESEADATQALAELGVTMDPVLLALIAAGVAAIIVTPIFAVIFYLFIRHNKKRSAVKLLSVDVQETENEDMPNTFKIKDALNLPFWLIIIIYIIYVFLLF